MLPAVAYLRNNILKQLHYKQFIYNILMFIPRCIIKDHTIMFSLRCIIIKVSCYLKCILAKSLLRCAAKDVLPTREAIACRMYYM